MLKTKKAAAKRFKVTGSGRIFRKKAGRRHLLECKSAKKKRKLCTLAPVAGGQLKAVRRIIPGV